MSGYGKSFRDEGSWRPETKRGINSAHFAGKMAGSRDYNRYYGNHDQFLQKKTNTFKGVGPKGYTRSDDSILDEVCDILTRDNNINATEIEVSVKNNVVYLSGTVNIRKEKWAAEMKLEGISGVQDIQNNIKVSKWGSFPQSLYEREFYSDEV